MPATDALPHLESRNETDIWVNQGNDHKSINTSVTTDRQTQSQWVGYKETQSDLRDGGGLILLISSIVIKLLNKSRVFLCTLILIWYNFQKEVIYQKQV